MQTSVGKDLIFSSLSFSDVWMRIKNSSQVKSSLRFGFFFTRIQRKIQFYNRPIKFKKKQS
jgi:hypothetical protein